MTKIYQLRIDSHILDIVRMLIIFLLKIILLNARTINFETLNVF